MPKATPVFLFMIHMTTDSIVKDGGTVASQPVPRDITQAQRRLYPTKYFFVI